MKSNDIGPRLRAARVKTGMSLRSVANAIGVSPSLLSQVETGKTHPSVSTLYALVMHLGISTDDLLGIQNAQRNTASPSFSQPNPSALTDGNLVIQRAEDNPILIMENGVQWEKLAVSPGGAADALLVTYEPGASSSVEGHLMRHHGLEHAYILEGELTLQLEFDLHVLKAGDSIYFNAIRPHMYLNKSDANVRGIWFVLGRRAMNENSHPASALVTTPKATDRSPVSAVEVMQAWD